MVLTKRDIKIIEEYNDLMKWGGKITKFYELLTTLNSQGYIEYWEHIKVRIEDGCFFIDESVVQECDDYPSIETNTPINWPLDKMNDMDIKEYIIAEATAEATLEKERENLMKRLKYEEALKTVNDYENHKNE